jgi:hypothetical protein
MSIPTKDVLTAGFWFGIHLAQSMGLEADTLDLVVQLRRVASGELSLVPSPEALLRDWRRMAQKATGRPPTDADLELYRSQHSPERRAKEDALNRSIAAEMIRQIVMAALTNPNPPSPTPNLPRSCCITAKTA